MVEVTEPTEVINQWQKNIPKRPDALNLKKKFEDIYISLSFEEMFS